MVKNVLRCIQDEFLIFYYSSLFLHLSKEEHKRNTFFFLSHKTSFIWWQVLLLTAVSSWFRIFSVVFLRHNFCWLSLIRIFFRGFASFTEATEVGSVGGGVWSSLMVQSLINKSVQEITGVIFLNFRHTFLRNINFLSNIVFHSAPSVLWAHQEAKCVQYCLEKGEPQCLKVQFSRKGPHFRQLAAGLRSSLHQSWAQ